MNNPPKICDLFTSRRSARALDPNKLVTNVEILALCEAARWAPSAMNAQPWSFLVLKKYEANYQVAFDILSEGNKIWVKNAPILIIAFAETINESTGKTNPTAYFDTGLAVENLIIQAVELGLIAHPMSGFDHYLLDRNLGIPENYKSVVIIAIGHPGNINELANDDLINKEKAERVRKDISVNFFKSSFGTPIV